MATEINLFEKEIEHSTETKGEPPAAKLAEPPPASKLKDKKEEAHVKRIIEALLFSSNAPVSFNKIQEIIDEFYALKPRAIREILQGLSEEYIVQDRAFRLEQIAEGYILRTCQELSPYIELMHRNRRTEKLSQAAAEVLAIIAYRQPITRPQIDAIRGVDSSGTLYSLMERELIEPMGKLDAPGRPSLYGTTKNFLHYFGFKDVKDLPRI